MARGRGRGLTLAELLVVAAVLALALALLIPAALRARDEARRIRCRANLNLVAQGIAVYLQRASLRYPFPLGRGLRADDFNGAEWLAMLYWTRVVPDPGVFLCPGSGDTNHAGRDLGAHHAVAGRFGSQTVSYAGLHYHSFTRHDGSAWFADTWSWGAREQVGERAMIPSDCPVACDDTEGSAHHAGGATTMLFLDSHVDLVTPTELAFRGWSPPALPAPLRN